MMGSVEQQSGDSKPVAETRDMRPSFIDWLITQDVDVAFGVMVLEMDQPDTFATTEAQIAYVSQWAILAGKRELLNDLVDKFGPDFQDYPNPDPQ